MMRTEKNQTNENITVQRKAKKKNELTGVEANIQKSIDIGRGLKLPMRKTMI